MSIGHSAVIAGARPNRIGRPGVPGPGPDVTDTVQHELPTAGWFRVAPMAVAVLLSFFAESGALWALLLLIPSQPSATDSVAADHG